MPTDFEILRAIRARHYNDYVVRVRTEHPNRILIPLDIEALADDLGMEQELLWGRLYYHLDPLYRERADGPGPKKVFFTPRAGEDENCVNFPLLDAVLAGEFERRRRDTLAVSISVVSLVIALASLLVAVLR